ncbi:MAG TPA: hypothetical protein VGD13_01965 [Xanthobacteraceae bacterium]
MQKLDEEDGACLAGLRDEALRRIAPRAPSIAPASFSQLIMTRIAAAMRHAIALEPKQARAYAGAIQANAAEEPRGAGNVLPTARTPPHMPGSSFPSAGAGRR